MAYHLLNIETSEYYYSDEQEWVTAINIALQNEWDCDGTIFDVMYETEEQCFDNDDPLHFFYALNISTNEALYWDGNYFEKRNQIVSYEDTIYLAMALNGTDTNPELIEFIKKGSFRICSD